MLLLASYQTCTALQNQHVDINKRKKKRVFNQHGRSLQFKSCNSENYLPDKGDCFVFFPLLGVRIIFKTVERSSMPFCSSQTTIKFLCHVVELGVRVLCSREKSRSQIHLLIWQAHPQNCHSLHPQSTATPFYSTAESWIKNAFLEENSKRWRSQHSDN